MDNIDVLLKAAEYVESQGCLVNETRVQNHLNIDSSLSPISSASYSSSSSSSLFNSPNNSNNQTSAKNDQNLFQHKIAGKTNPNSSTDTNSSVYSSSLPSNFVSLSNFSKSKTNDQTASTINKSMSRLEEMKRDKAIHNTLEKNRRAHLKGCFESLQNELPQYKDKKCTNLAILNYTLKFIELSKKKNKENEVEKKRLLEEQFRLKKNLAQLALDFKAEYLQKHDENSADEATAKFNSILQSLNINPDTNHLTDFKSADQEIDFDQKPNSYSNTATSPKQIVAKYYRKRSSNSLSMITGIKTIQPTQSLQLQLQNHLKVQKTGKRLNGQHRHRHYSVDDSIMEKQRNRKKTVSTSRNDFEASVDEENDDFDDEHSIDETNTTLDYDIDSNSLADKDADARDAIDDDEESRDLVINEDEQEANKLNKEETVDIETLSDKSSSPTCGQNSVKNFDPNDCSVQQKRNVSQMIVKNAIATHSSGTNAQRTSVNFSNYHSSNFFKGMLSKTGNLGYINTSLISNVQNLNLKPSVQESTSANSSFKMNIKQIKLNASLYQKQKQTNVNPKQ